MQRSNRVEQVADDLTRRIVGGEWAIGTRLPSVRELSKSYEVAQPTVREAVRILLDRLLVDVIHGSGIWVRKPEARTLAGSWRVSPQERAEFIEVLEARRYMEESVVRLAVLRASDRALDEVHNAWEGLRDAGTDAQSFVEADTEFHAALARAAGNRVISGALGALEAPLRRVFLNALSRLLETGISIEVPICHHGDLLDMVSRRDEPGALEALSIVQKPTEDYLRHVATDRSVSVTELQLR